MAKKSGQHLLKKNATIVLRTHILFARLTKQTVKFTHIRDEHRTKNDLSLCLTLGAMLCSSLSHIISFDHSSTAMKYECQTYDVTARFYLEYCNPRVGYPYPYLGTGMKLTGTGRVRVENFCTGRVQVRKIVPVQYSIFNRITDFTRSLISISL
jgi:hypothetical protein